MRGVRSLRHVDSIANGAKTLGIVFICDLSYEARAGHEVVIGYMQYCPPVSFSFSVEIDPIKISIILSRRVFHLMAEVNYQKFS